MICVRCSTDKPGDSFYANDRTCKACRCAMVKANRASKADYYREYDRLRASRAERVANAERVAAEWRQQHPERRRAQVALGNAVRATRQAQ
jgi:hypothetical protein